MGSFSASAGFEDGWNCVRPGTGGAATLGGSVQGIVEGEAMGGAWSCSLV